MKLDNIKQTLTMTTEEMSFVHKILELRRDKLTIETSQGVKMIMEKVK